MATGDERDQRRMKRRIAATAATAALALSGPAAAARPAAARSPGPARPGGDRVARLTTSDQNRAALSLDATRRSEMISHRRRLAGALAAELGNRDAAALERAIAAAETEVSDAYARGERPRFVAGIPAALADATGLSEDELGAAFESMSRHARERRRPGHG
jgi:hypothetical protein